MEWKWLVQSYTFGNQREEVTQSGGLFSSLCTWCYGHFDPEIPYSESLNHSPVPWHFLGSLYEILMLWALLTYIPVSILAFFSSLESHVLFPLVPTRLQRLIIRSWMPSATFFFLCLFSSSYFWVVSGWSGSNGVHPLSKISIELKRRRKAHSWMLELTIKEGINRKLLCLEGSIWQDSSQFLQQALRDPIWDRCLIHVCGINKWLNVFSYLVVLKHFWNHGSSHWLEQWLTVWVPVIKYWGPLRKSLLFPHSI